MSKFDPQLYSQYRTHYPLELFEPLRSFLGSLRSRPITVLDLGAGTGISSRSFLSLFSEVDLILVEPDRGMLDESLATLSSFEGKVKRVEAQAESFQIEEAVDLVLIGSAWHWMDSAKALDAMKRCLRPGGAIFIFEYQFPKARVPEHLALNEWVRREFNLKWRVLGQKPRGTLRELTECLRAEVGFVERSVIHFEKQESFTLEAFWGALVSQSRYLAYEKTVSLAEGVLMRENLREELRPFWGPRPELQCSYWLEGRFFQRAHV